MSNPRKFYRIYRFDGVLKIVSVDEIDADGDSEIIAQLENGDFGLMCEIWEGQRLVAKLEAERRAG